MAALGVSARRPASVTRTGATSIPRDPAMTRLLVALASPARTRLLVSFDPKFASGRVAP